MSTSPDNAVPQKGRPPAKAMACEEIQALLYDYLTHEIGRARGELIREHIRKCDGCRAAAADVQATLRLLQGASAQERREPLSLSIDRRKRIWRAFMHPVLDRMYRHHIFVSILIAILALLIGLLAITRVSIIWKVRADDHAQRLPWDADGTILTNATDEQGWYMIRDKNGETWFYHPDGASNRPAARAEPGRDPN